MSLRFRTALQFMPNPGCILGSPSRKPPTETSGLLRPKEKELNTENGPNCLTRMIPPIIAYLSFFYVALLTKSKQGVGDYVVHIFPLYFPAFCRISPHFSLIFPLTPKMQIQKNCISPYVRRHEKVAFLIFHLIFFSPRGCNFCSNPASLLAFAERRPNSNGTVGKGIDVRNQILDRRNEGKPQLFVSPEQTIVSWWCHPVPLPPGGGG